MLSVVTSPDMHQGGAPAQSTPLSWMRASLYHLDSDVGLRSKLKDFQIIIRRFMKSSSMIQMNTHGAWFVSCLRSANQNEGDGKYIGHCCGHHRKCDPSCCSVCRAQPAARPCTNTGLLGKYLNIRSVWRRSVARRPGTGTGGHTTFVNIKHSLM